MSEHREPLRCAAAGCTSEATVEFVVNETARLPRCGVHAVLLRRTLGLNPAVKWREEEIRRR